MLVRLRLSIFLLTVFALSACSSAPTAKSLAQESAGAMGGIEKLQSIKTLRMKGGEGTRLEWARWSRRQTRKALAS